MLDSCLKGKLFLMIADHSALITDWTQKAGMFKVGERPGACCDGLLCTYLFQLPAQMQPLNDLQQLSCPFFWQAENPTHALYAEGGRSATGM